MALKPKIALPDKTFTLFKRGVDASVRETRQLQRLWEKNVDKTFGEIPRDWDDQTVRVNKEFSRVKQKQSLLFFRVPEVQLKPLRPDAESVAATAAAALNQVLSREMQVSYMMDEVLTDALCPAGIGVSRISYEVIRQKVKIKPPEFKETPDPVFDGLVESGVAQYQEIDAPTYEAYSWRRVPYQTFLYPTDFDGSHFDEAPWLGLSFTMPRMEAKRQFKLSDKELEAAKCGPGEHQGDTERKEDITDKVKGYEIWYRACYFDPKVAHKDHFRKLVYFDGMETPVVHEDSPYQRVENGRVIGVTRYPIRVLSLTYVPDRAIPPSDVTITRPAMAELERTRTLMMLQRERSLPIRWFDTNQVDETAESLLQDGVIQGWLPTNGPAGNAIGEIARANYPRENFEFNRVIEQDISEAWAIGAEQMGQAAPGETTAKEVMERASAAQTRLDYERSKVLRFFKEGAEVVFGLLQQFATQPKYTELVGEDGAARLVQWNAQTIQGEFAFEARPDAALRLDAASDRQQALNLFTLLANDPFVDRRKLLTEVLRTHNLTPEAVLLPQPPQPQPERPNLSIRLDSDAFDPTRPHALLMYDLLEKYGIQLDPAAVQKARELATRMLTLAAQNPLLALADTTRVDIRSDGAPPSSTPMAQPAHPGAVTPVPRLNKTVAEEGRTNKN